MRSGRCSWPPPPLLLLRAVRRDTRAAWAAYAAAAAAMLYTHLLSIPVLVAHAIVLATTAPRGPVRRRGLLAMGLAALAFSPWLVVLMLRIGAARAGTAWGDVPVSPLLLARSWLGTATAVFVRTGRSLGPTGDDSTA